MISYKKYTFNNNQTAVDELKYLLAKLKIIDDVIQPCATGLVGESKEF